MTGKISSTRMILSSGYQSSLTFACILLFFQTSNALVLQTAPVTSACHNIGLQHSFIPHATPPPVPIAELRIRQAQASLATCGYINGDGDLAVTCGASLYCATTSTFVGCCERSNCLDIFTKCYDLLGSPCDQACQNNPQNLVCPSSLPYCARYNYESGSVGLGCARVSGYTSTVLLTTKTPNPPFIPSSNTTSSTVTSTAVPPASSTSSGLSTGATAGIAVGATLAAVALLLLAWFFWRKHKKSKGRPANTEPITTSEAKEVDATPHPDRMSKFSELASSPRTPLSPDFYSGQKANPEPPRYSQTQYYEMDGDNRPVSYPTTEISSTRG